MGTDQERRRAPELRVDEWIGPDGQPLDRPVRLGDLGSGFRIIFCFQHWCPGCHAHGFPTLRYLYDRLADSDIGIAVIQTVFEGAEENTSDKLRIDQEKYGLAVPFGQDVPPEGRDLPTFMEDYRTGGTPWFTIIDPEGAIVYAGFQLDPDALLEVLGVGR
ncbi:peroxiredoxin family protein [Tsukamurella pseudospumae]|uniref:Thiol-disulfide isomerase n=1 Tax=Tsukamurella pseudospumae TaxID=239498 RepID=A0A137YSU9_9ACTN|nr:thiol-disulfide isomerase [Tsukamurella pseudospumae]KXO88988.1 thiol-disulfide isomerase [Tsukamurella pseudospumae]